jgi:hypothetical protein
VAIARWNDWGEHRGIQLAIAMRLTPEKMLRGCITS